MRVKDRNEKHEKPVEILLNAENAQVANPAIGR